MLEVRESNAGGISTRRSRKGTLGRLAGRPPCLARTQRLSIAAGCASLPSRLHHEAGTVIEPCSSSRNGLPVFFSFSSSRAVQSQSPQAHGSEPFSSRHLRRSFASCTLTSSKYSSQ